MNSVADIKKYLSTPEDPLSTGEFMEWWNSLSDEEKDEFKNTELK